MKEQLYSYLRETLKEGILILSLWGETIKRYPTMSLMIYGSFFLVTITLYLVARL